MKRSGLILAAVLMAASVALATACTRKQAVETGGTAATETSVRESETPSKTTAQTGEGTAREEETTQAEQKQMYHMLQGTVTKVAGDGSVFTLQADDGKDYDIKRSDIRDVEIEIKEEVQVAIVYIGEPLGALKDVTLVVALPEQEEWSILTEEGITTANAMSSFSMKTDDGQELSFMKDNCPMEDGALSGDSGDKVRVTYVNSQGVNYPVEIKSAD